MKIKILGLLFAVALFGNAYSMENNKNTKKFFNKADFLDDYESFFQSADNESSSPYYELLKSENTQFKDEQIEHENNNFFVFNPEQKNLFKGNPIFWREEDHNFSLGFGDIYYGYDSDSLFKNKKDDEIGHVSNLNNSVNLNVNNSINNNLVLSGNNVLSMPQMQQLMQIFVTNNFIVNGNFQIPQGQYQVPQGQTQIFGGQIWPKGCKTNERVVINDKKRKRDHGLEEMQEIELNGEDKNKKRQKLG